MPDKEFGPGVRYDTGQHTSIAINSSNIFVEVHRTHRNSDDTLWYHTGIINEMGIHWSPPRQYDDKGDTPSVGANDKFAVEVHTVGARGVSDDQIVIACRLGVFDSEHPRQLTWEPQVALGYGIEPKIAVAPDGTIIVISGDRYVAGQMTYRPGRIDAQTKRIVWGVLIGPITQITAWASPAASR